MFDVHTWQNREEQIKLVFDALQERDFEKAAKISPEGYKLCGYQEFTEKWRYEQYGYGWAGQFEVTEIAPGLYPVFAREYSFNENKNMFTNELKNYPGICFWYSGTLVSSSERNDELPRPNVSHSLPYVHSVAKDIVNNNSKVHLLPPYEARKVFFEYEGEQLSTYKIIDTSLPSFMKENPMLQAKESPHPSLDDQIRKSKSIPFPNKDIKPLSPNISL